MKTKIIISQNGPDDQDAEVVEIPHGAPDFKRDYELTDQEVF